MSHQVSDTEATLFLGQNVCTLSEVINHLFRRLMSRDQELNFKRPISGESTKCLGIEQHSGL